jgi:integrase
MSAEVEVVSFGGASCRVARRGDGRWVVRWREAGRGRSTTSVSHDGAIKLARAKVRELAGSSGGVMVSGAEMELVRRLKAVAGSRSPHSVLDQLEEAVRRLGGWEVLGRALRFYESSGMASVERVTVRVARGRFLDLYESKARLTRAGLRKELDAFCEAYGELAVCDVSAEILGPWIARKRADGEPVGARFANNRLDSWRTFFNKCRAWNYWPRGEKHPAELLERQREVSRLPPIWSVATVRAALGAVERRYWPYLVLGCFAGLRPFELTRLKWEQVDWVRGYVHVLPEVAQKTLQERFVPLEANARELLEPWRGKVGKCCQTHDREEISVVLRAAGVIEVWPQDVMRHSYISYRIARGDGAGLVAEHSGNSERIIRRHYRRPLRREDGVAWFGVGLVPGVGDG